MIIFKGFVAKHFVIWSANIYKFEINLEVLKLNLGRQLPNTLFKIIFFTKHALRESKLKYHFQ